MNNKFLFSVILIFCVFSTVFSISKVYKGKAISTKISDGVQYVKAGRKPSVDLTGDQIVVYIDDQDYSVKFTLNGSTNPDSAIYHFIPGDQFSARISANIEWDSAAQYYRYDYQIQSLDESKIPIKTFMVSLDFEPLKSKSPKGWDLYARMGHHSWSHWRAPKIMPGDLVSGFGFESESPPNLGEVYLSGVTDVIGGGINPEGYQQLDKFLSDHDDVECITLIPASKPEKINAPIWVGKIKGDLGKLSFYGFLSSEHRQSIYNILSNLHNQLREAENSTFDKWNPLVSQTLDALSPYQSQIEPEAWSYITENLKYMQRNKDIVWFGK